MERDSKTSQDLNFPRVKNIEVKLLGDEIFPFIPHDKENMAEWNKMFSELASNIKDDFDKKGISLPSIIINHSREPIIKKQ